jgi:hypothetical protein
MAAGLGYIEFTTGDILTASAANGYLASQVVMVFADAAARTSAIASPQEGMISYLKDTNSTEYYSGSAWVAIGGGGSSSDFVRISTTSFSGSSAVNLNNVFSTTYKNYMVVLNITSASGTGNLQSRLRVSGADNTTSNYYSIYDYILASGATAGSTKKSAATEWQFTFISDAQTAIPFTVSNPFESTQTFVAAPDFFAGDGYKINAGGWFSAATSFTGMSFFPTTGTITGEVSVYGLKRA